MKILGIETSCDETAVALVEDGTKVIANLVSSQVELHQPFGGVVPELAARAHLENLLPLLAEAGGPRLLDEVGAIAYTQGPGLIGALLVGALLARSLAFARGIPAIGVNHLKAHLYAPCLSGKNLEFPLVGLIVSGGHTLLIEADSWDDSRVLGSTRDDAAGEAFDKVANLLDLGYPGGPRIEAAAAQGAPDRFAFPRGMLRSGDYDFSFSGLKTAVRQEVEKFRSRGEALPVADIAASFQAAVVEVLAAKLTEAIRESAAACAVLGGGVAINSVLRRRLADEITLPGCRLLLSPPVLCGDNAAMIAGLAFQKIIRADRDGTGDVSPSLSWGKTLY